MSYESALNERQRSTIARISKVEYDFLVFIGRFCPFHNGHYKVIREALARSKSVIILVGSAFSPRSYRKPFTFAEIREMILGSFEGEDRSRIFVQALDDSLYDNAKWLADVQDAVHAVVTDVHEFDSQPKIGLIGHSKDHTSYYLRQFQRWGSINVDAHLDTKDRTLSATHLREPYFEPSICDAWLHGVEELVPDNVAQFLRDFTKTPGYKYLVKEYQFIRDYRKGWVEAPYPPTFVTADALVVCGSYVLLVKRGAHPGLGLWALPGGFIKQTETIEEAALRELTEETKIRVPEIVLQASLQGSQTFDEPYRDPRGRFITHCHLVHLTREIKLPKVKGSDDAVQARWVEFRELRREDLAFDHFDIIQAMLPRLKQPR